MSNTFAFGKRVLAVATAVATIAWAIGIAAFAVPATAQAASAGDLIKGTSLSTVYYYGYDGLRYTFPNLKTYNTWYPDFSGVSILSDSAVADIDLGGNVVYRPGSRWVKIQSDTKTYAVSTSGTIHWIETEAVATGFAGSDWNTVIDDVPDVFFVDYSVAASLMSATAFDGMMYMDGANYVLSWAGEKRVVSAAGRTANRMQDRFFLDGTGIDDSALTAGAQITSNICNLTDAAQTGCTTGVASGAVNVSLSSSTPAGATLPLGANSVQVLKFDLKAGSEAATVDGLAISMVGVGATTNVTNVYLYEGNDRLTEARSVNASTRKATFNNLNLALAAGQTRTLTVRVETNTSSAAGDQLQFAVSAATDVTSAGTVSGSFPVTGNAFTLATVSAGYIVVEKNGTITSPTLGAQDHTIGQFRITANSEAASVREITLKIDNASDHSDFKLYNGTTLLGAGTYLGGKLVKFDLSSSPLAIAEGANKILKVTADIGGDATDGIGVYIDKAVDIVAIGGDYGFGMTAYIGASSAVLDTGTYSGVDAGSSSGICNETGDECSYSTIQGGDITLAFNGPSAGDISVNSQDVSLFEFSLTAKSAITVKDLDMIVYGEDNGGGNAFVPGDDSTDDDDGLINTNGEGNLKDLKIVNIDTGAVILGPLELDCVTTTCGAAGTQDGTQTIDFTDDFYVAAGETLNLRLTADVDNNVAIDSGDAAGVQFGATLDISGFVAEDSNGTTVATSSIVPSSNLVGFNQTAQSSSLTVQLASSPTATTVVQGTNGVDFLGAIFTAGNSSDATITSLTFTGYGDASDFADMTAGGATDAQVEDFMSSCSLYDDSDALLDGPKSISTAGVVVFDTIDWTIPAGMGETATLKCNVANPSVSTDAYFAFDLLGNGGVVTTSQSVVAQDKDGNAISATLTATGSGNDGINDIETSDSTFGVGVGVVASSVGITITENGSLAVSAASSTPASDFILTSSTDVHVASYTFLATNEAFEVQTFTVSEEQAEDDTGTADSAAYANNVSKVKIEYPKQDGSTGTASVSMAGNEAKFSGIHMYVGEADTATIKVYVSTPATDRVAGGSATSNEKLELGFFVDASGLDNFKAVGLSSGTTLSDSDASAITTGIGTFVVRETKPTVTVSASSPSGTGFVPGDREVLRFNVAANSNEDIVLEELIFQFSSTDNATTLWNYCDQGGAGNGEIAEADFDLYNLSTTGTTTAIEGVDTTDWTLLTTDGTECTDSLDLTTHAHLDLTTPQVIPAGTTYTYALYFDSTGASSANDDSIQFSIPADAYTTTYLTGTTINDGAITRTDATLTLTSGAVVTAGDVVCFSGADTTCDSGEEKALVASVSTNNVTFVRGYLGTDLVTPVTTQNVIPLHGTMLWRDDGLTSTATYPQQVYWGSYLVDNLPISGGAMGF